MTTMTSPANGTTVNNGVNVDALLGAREALEQAPQAAQFKWRATCEWMNGTHSRTMISTFFGLGGEQSRGKTFAVEADHPQIFAAEDQAPTAVEIVRCFVRSFGKPAHFDRIDSGRDLLACRVCQLPRCGQGDGGVAAKPHISARLAETIAEQPALRPARRDAHV
jgi:hypothetical protein